MSDPQTNQQFENRRKGDGQRGHDEYHEYPKALYKGQDMALADDADSEIALVSDGWAAPAAAVNPLADEVARLRAELAAKRGPGRPPRVPE